MSEEEVLKRITIEIEEFNLRFAMQSLRTAKSHLKWAYAQGLVFIALGVFNLMYAFFGNPWYTMSVVIYCGAGVFFIWWGRRRWEPLIWRALRNVAKTRVSLKKAMSS